MNSTNFASTFAPYVSKLYTIICYNFRYWYLRRVDRLHLRMTLRMLAHRTRLRILLEYVLGSLHQVWRKLPLTNLEHYLLSEPLMAAAAE